MYASCVKEVTYKTYPRQYNLAEDKSQSPHSLLLMLYRVIDSVVTGKEEIHEAVNGVVQNLERYYINYNCPPLMPLPIHSDSSVKC